MKHMPAELRLSAEGTPAAVAALLTSDFSQVPSGKITSRNAVPGTAARK